MIVLIADGIIIIMMIMIGKITEAIAVTASKGGTTIPKINEEKIGMVEIKEAVIPKTGDNPMIAITNPPTGMKDIVKEMTATGIMIVPTDGTDTKIL